LLADTHPAGAVNGLFDGLVSDLRSATKSVPARLGAGSVSVMVVFVGALSAPIWTFEIPPLKAGSHSSWV